MLIIENNREIAPMTELSFKSEYKKIGELFSGTLKYIIPPYQRDYSWNSNDQILDFWNDLNDSMERDKDHFFGNILLRRNHENEDAFDILDGQQRLASITILLAVIRDELYSIGAPEKQSNIVHQSIEIITDERTLEPVERLRLNLRNKEFFSDYIQRDYMDKQRKTFDKSMKVTSTNKLIMDAYIYLQKEVEKKLASKASKQEKIDCLTSISSHIKRRFGVIETIVGSTADAYKLFMPLNYRGLDLSVADLFKTHIIETSSQDKKDDATAIWNEIADMLDNAGIVDFLRHFWASKIASVGEKDLYDEFVKYLKKRKRKQSYLQKN